ncbi:MAG: HlyD family efflux transporter periplasmic adaptor subunit [Proteobacteria bacterium]|nr:HlyD family efflux transporter periplasmic adaptor subunit [Pseudomonadota bacterium]MCL2306949.1 HlyD family efflux transporter periplasmic adaptor subunit [Pseudomonadota bacterium]
MSCVRWLQVVAVIFTGMLLGACAEKAAETYQGYAEGEYIYVASPLGGRLDVLAVRRGAIVEDGAPLFALESEKENAALQQAQAQLATAKAQLSDIQTGRRLPEVQVIEAQLAQAQAQAKQAAIQAERDEKQFAIGGIAEAQRDDSRSRAETAAARVRELNHQIEVARLPNRAQQIKAQEAQVTAMQAALEQADWALRQKTVTALKSGEVVDTLYREGEWVAAGAPVVKLLPPQNVKVRFFVPEAHVGALKRGQAVRLVCDGCAAPVDATITYISDRVEYTPPVIFSNESRAKLVFMVEAHPQADGARSLHPGQPVSVRLL